MVSGFSIGDVHIDFKVVDGAFRNGSDFISDVPFLRIPLQSEEYAEFYIFISIVVLPYLAELQDGHKHRSSVIYSTAF